MSPVRLCMFLMALYCLIACQVNMLIFYGAASEIQMMALPHAQYVIAEASTPVSGVNSNQVKTVSEGCLITVR